MLLIQTSDVIKPNASNLNAKPFSRSIQKNGALVYIPKDQPEIKKNLSINMCSAVFHIWNGGKCRARGHSLRSLSFDWFWKNKHGEKLLD